MTAPTLVVLAAGKGTRFGGPKQLVAVRDDGATISDVNIERAAAAGIDRAVVVVGEHVAEAMGAHLAERSPRVRTTLQGGSRGTAQALLAVRDLTEGPVVVVNADDIYPVDAFGALAGHFATVGTESATDHAVVGFHLARTFAGPKPQSRALLVQHDGHLVTLREGRVETDPTWSFTPLAEPDAVAEPVAADALVSMNLFALGRSVFDVAEAALEASDAAEVYLPDVVATVIGAGERVKVLECAGPCHGLTYADDIGTLDDLL